MTINISRFYGRERIRLDCEVITPMFLGDAGQNAALRTAPFKGMLRYWWRVSTGGRYKSSSSLYQAEAAVFGSPDDKGGKSKVAIAVAEKMLSSAKERFASQGFIIHKEVNRNNGRIDPLNYLAGIGLIHPTKGVQKPYFKTGGGFSLHLTAPPNLITEPLMLFRLFAAIGNRSRNGWGSLQVETASSGIDLSPGPAVEQAVRPFEEAFDRDYPHCLGKDEKGLLLWRTSATYPSWENCMKKLAEIYLATRLTLNIAGQGKQERHLLGYPVTNHPVPGWQRHASALRLLVKRDDSGTYRGCILHLPHAFSRRMWDLDTYTQTRIWRGIHRKLDEAMQRAKLEEMI